VLFGTSAQAARARGLLDAVLKDCTNTAGSKGGTSPSSIALPTAKMRCCRSWRRSWFNCDWTQSWRTARRQPSLLKMPREEVATAPTQLSGV